MNVAYNMDCMEYMRTLLSLTIDLAVVDPPYGINVNRMTLGNGKRIVCRGRNDWDSCIPKAEYFSELFRVSRNQIIFGGNYFTSFLPPSMGWIFWDKCTGANDFSDGELAWTSFQTHLRKFTKLWLGNNAKENNEHDRIHPTQKPVALYAWIYKNYAKPGMKILDTHLGSGSSRIAAWDAGLDFVGTEIDETYFNLQEERFKKHIAQGTIFDTEMEAQAEQMSLIQCGIESQKPVL